MSSIPISKFCGLKGNKESVSKHTSICKDYVTIFLRKSLQTQQKKEHDPWASTWKQAMGVRHDTPAFDVNYVPCLLLPSWEVRPQTWNLRVSRERGQKTWRVAGAPTACILQGMGAARPGRGQAEAAYKESPRWFWSAVPWQAHTQPPSLSLQSLSGTWLLAWCSAGGVMVCHHYELFQCHYPGWWGHFVACSPLIWSKLCNWQPTLFLYPYFTFISSA